MQFSSKEDIEAPIGSVFSAISDFETFERAAMRRGIEVSRVDEHAPVATGLAWQTRFSLRGRPRDLRLVLTQLRQPDSLALAFDSKGWLA